MIQVSVKGGSDNYSYRGKRTQKPKSTAMHISAFAAWPRGKRGIPSDLVHA